MHFLGLTLANLSEFDEAREIFLKVISIDANIAEAHYNLGRIEEILGNTAKALIFYQKAIGIAPNFHLFTEVGLITTISFTGV